MPTYDYCCNNCEHNFEVYQSFEDDKLTLCPECKQRTLERLIGCPFFFIKGEPKTLQHLAERNTTKFGKNECEERELKAKERVKAARRAKGLEQRDKASTPWWRNGEVPTGFNQDTPLSPEQCEKTQKELQEIGVNFKADALPPKRKKNGNTKK